MQQHTLPVIASMELDDSPTFGAAAPTDIQMRGRPSVLHCSGAYLTTGRATWHAVNE